MKYYIKTFGCQLNISDSERIAGFLEMHKIKPARDINQADLVIFNTCGVRQSAEDRVYGQIHNLHKTCNMKHKTIVVTGCLANRKDFIRRLKDKVDLFCEIKDFPREISSFLARHPEDGTKPDEGSSKKYRKQCYKADSSFRWSGTQNDGLYFNILPKYRNKHTAFVPVMTGCNNFCSYCVVPYARGPEVSRPAGEIIKEIKSLIKNGYKEIILLGQNVNSYKDTSLSSSPLVESLPAGRQGSREAGGEGKNKAVSLIRPSGTFSLREKGDFLLKENKIITFPALLKKVNAIPGNFWISFISNHPKYFSDELIETATKLKKVCELIHLPMQAGSNKILEKMNRKYTAKQYLALVDKIKKAFRNNKPGKIYAITSDIIVGFPGETKKQFLESAKIMERVGYDMVYFGQFSPRPGTVAYKMNNNVSKHEKERRENYLNEILKKTAYNNNKKYIGKELEVLVTEKKNGYYFGHTRTMKNVKIISAKNKLIGKIIKLKISKANAWNLEALKK